MSDPLVAIGALCILVLLALTIFLFFAYMQVQAELDNAKLSKTEARESFEQRLEEILLRHNQAMNDLKIKHEFRIKEAIKEARADSNKRQRAVIRGQATEHLAPFINDDYAPKDFRFVGDPIDYLVCVGSSAVSDGEANEIDAVILMDIKTGKSKLNKVQRRIRDAVVDGRVRFETYNPDTGETRKWGYDE